MIRKKIIFLSVLSCFVWSFLSGQKLNETGYYLNVINFQPLQTRSHPQNWDITQDNRGILYFANNDGVLEFDGIDWRTIKFNNNVVRSLDVDEKGIVYVGLEPEEFGFLEPDNIGNLKFTSLSALLDSRYTMTGGIEMIKATKDGVFFQSNNYLFFWNGQSFNIWEPENSYHTVHYVNNQLFVRDEGIGLKVLKDGKFNLIKNGERFADKAIADIIPFNEDALIITTTNGFFRIKFSSDQDIEPIRHFNELDNFLAENIITCAIRINDSKFAIGTQGSGVVIFNQKNDQFNVIDNTSGLQAEAVNNMYLDKQNNLWLALNKGLSAFHAESPLTFFGYNTGIKETVEGITRYNNRLFISTHLGIKYLDKFRNEEKYIKNSFYGLNFIEGFRSIEKFDEAAFALTEFKINKENMLLAAGFNGVYSINKDFKPNLIKECYPWFLKQSKKIPNRVIIANDDGISSIYRRNSKWIYESYLDSIDANCRSITEDSDGNIWVGGDINGNLFKLKYKNNKAFSVPEVSHFDTLSGLPDGPVIPVIIDGKLMTGTTKGIYKFDAEDQTFILDSVFFRAFGNEFVDIHRINPDYSGKIWCDIYLKNEGYYQLGYLEKVKEDYTWVFAPFNSFSKGIIHAIFHEENGITWLGGPDGLYRYDSSVKKNYNIEFQALIRKIKAGEDSILFNGNFVDENNHLIDHQIKKFIPILKYKLNTINFTFSAQINEDESPVEFSHYLEGFESKWSSWGTDNFASYTNLSERTYTFHVKARNMYGFESKESSYTFTIKPPWFRTIPAYLLFLISLTALIWLIIVSYTKNLRRIIKERTAEIRFQKEEIENKSKDILSSIQYAKRIQSALLPPDDYLDDFIPNRFIFYKPRDIVSGDFFWITEKDSKVIIVTADCTGHGVPGAMMSMLGMAFLNEIITKTENLNPASILEQLRSEVIDSLRQTGKEGEAQDGMDLSLCIYDFKNMILEYSGANSPLFLIRKGETLQFKADKMPIGISLKNKNSFTTKKIPLEKGDLIYTFSDGFPDQFGGEKDRKFMIKNLRLLFEKIHQEPMKIQEKILDEELAHWMGESSQVDDILIIGIKI
jgi:serine phosphatase RsbU (regulator of sigma subunit)/ligand-binding sensor domain-containing protein